MNRKISFVGTSVRKINEEDMSIEHVISTKALDRYNTYIIPKGADIRNFLKNPVVLWWHNIDNNPVKIPIAKCDSITISKDTIKVKTVFNEKDPLSVKVFQAYNDGFLNAWSIGFQPKEYFRYEKKSRKDLNKKFELKVTDKQIEEAGWVGIYVISKWELYEYSAVPVPANPEALNLEQKKKYCDVLLTRGLTSETDFSKLVCSIDEPNKEGKEVKVKVDKETKKEVKEEKKEEVKETSEENEKVPEEEKTDLEKLEEEQGTVAKPKKEEEEIEDLTIVKEPTEEPAKKEEEKKEKTEEPEVTKDKTDSNEELKEEVKELKEDIKDIKENVEKLFGVFDIVKKQGQELEKRIIAIKRGLSVDNIDSIRAFESEKNSDEESFDIVKFIHKQR